MLTATSSGPTHSPIATFVLPYRTRKRQTPRAAAKESHVAARSEHYRLGEGHLVKTRRSRSVLVERHSVVGPFCMGEPPPGRGEPGAGGVGGHRLRILGEVDVA